MSNKLQEAGISWTIIGAQTRPTVYPEISWVQSIVEAADRAGAKVFLKDNLGPLIDSNPRSDRLLMPFSFWNEGGLVKGFQLRQEMPDHYQGK